MRRRLETLIRELSKELEVLELRNKIQEQVQEQVSQSQREYLLREQLKAIHKELGESDDGQAEIDELREKLEKSGMSAEALKECDRELKRLSKMTPASAEYMVARTYLEWMISLPWTKSSGAEEIDIAKGQSDSRRGSLRPRKGEGAHPRLPGGEEAAAGHEGSDPVLPRASRRGENFAREIHCASARPQVRAHLDGRHARRSGNPRPSPDVYRRAAGTDHPGNSPGRNQRSGVHAGRGGQARTRFPRRSFGGVDGSARSGAERFVPRSLPRRAVRFVEGAVHRHGEHDRSDSGTAARSYGNHRARGLHGNREGPYRQQVPGAEAGDGTRTQDGRADRVHRRRFARDHSQLHA